jgi:hypothetical protein
MRKQGEQKKQKKKDWYMATRLLASIRSDKRQDSSTGV